LVHQVHHTQILLQAGLCGHLPLPRTSGARLQLPSVGIFQVVRHRVHEAHGQSVERTFPVQLVDRVEPVERCQGNCQTHFVQPLQKRATVHVIAVRIATEYQVALDTQCLRICGHSERPSLEDQCLRLKRIGLGQLGADPCGFCADCRGSEPALGPCSVPTRCGIQPFRDFSEPILQVRQDMVRVVRITVACRQRGRRTADQYRIVHHFCKSVAANRSRCHALRAASGTSGVLRILKPEPVGEGVVRVV